MHARSAAFSRYSAHAGQECSGTPYTVQNGDKLSKIADAQGTTTAAIQSSNPSITNPGPDQRGETHASFSVVLHQNQPILNVKPSKKYMSFCQELQYFCARAKYLHSR